MKTLPERRRSCIRQSDIPKTTSCQTTQKRWVLIKACVARFFKRLWWKIVLSVQYVAHNLVFELKKMSAQIENENGKYVIRVVVAAMGMLYWWTASILYCQWLTNSTLGVIRPAESFKRPHSYWHTICLTVAKQNRLVLKKIRNEFGISDVKKYAPRTYT